MTRKDYETIAAAIKAAAQNIDPDYSRETVNNMLHGVIMSAHALADALAQENPRFDRARFLKACGVE